MSAEQQFSPGALQTKFVAPPFSVLDTRQGYWQDRRRAWLSLGLRSELGRGAALVSGGGLLAAEQAAGMGKGRAEAYATGATRTGGMANTMAAGLSKARGQGAIPTTGSAGKRNAEMEAARARGAGDEELTAGAGTSIFDPVLCELAYRWWCPEGGRVLDPFAGGSVRGVVAAMLGHKYLGIDLSAEQLAANREQAVAILSRTDHPWPDWRDGDTLEVLPDLEDEGPFDMVLTCPPYFDLEVYSDDPRDLSNVTWGKFVELYAQAMAASARLLADSRFSVWVVSEVRDPQGYCRGLVPLTIQVAEAAGLRLYNEAILVNSAGSLPLRVTRYMEASRKLGRAHQNVLCFIKGSPPRGWSYERPAPPSPQLGFGFEAAVALEAPMPDQAPEDHQPGGKEDAPAPSMADALDLGEGPAEPTLAITCEDHEPGYHLTQEAADECSAETYGEAGWPTDDDVPEPAPSSPSATSEPEAAPDSAHRAMLARLSDEQRAQLLALLELAAGLEEPQEIRATVSRTDVPPSSDAQLAPIGGDMRGDTPPAPAPEVPV